MDERLESIQRKFQAGDLDGAEAEARAVLRASKEASDLETLGHARALLADIAYDRLRYPEARDQYRQASVELERVVPADSIAARQAHASLALVLHCLEDTAGAKAEIGIAHRGLDAVPETFEREAAGLWTTIGVVLDSVGHRSLARSILESVVRSAPDAIPDDDVPTLATAYLHLAGVVDDEDAELALQYERRCVALRQRVFGESNVRTASARMSISRLLVAQGDLESALAEARAAMAALKAAGAEGEPRSSTMWAGLGLAELLSGNTEEATRYFETACAMEERTFGASNFHTASMLVMLAQVHAGQKNWGKVAGLCKRAVPVLRESRTNEEVFASAVELDALSCLSLGRPRDAAERLRTAVDLLDRRATLAPKRRAKLWCLLGRAELAGGKVAPCLRAFERARFLAVEGDDFAEAEAIEKEMELVKRGGRIRMKGVT